MTVPAYRPALARHANTRPALLARDTLRLPSFDRPPLDMVTTLFWPRGPGPFPLFVFNHGKQFGDPRQQARSQPLALARLLVRRGYAVAAPNRKGFADSGGSHLSHWRNPLSGALCCAREIEAAIEALIAHPRIDPAHIVVAGHSYGALGTFAYGMKPHAGVRALVNLMGGLRSIGEDDWRTPLLKAFRHIGADVRLPALWCYAENDSFWSIDEARRLHAAYQERGARASFAGVGRFQEDAHRMIFHRAGLRQCWPQLAGFLDTLGA